VLILIAVAFASCLSVDRDTAGDECVDSKSVQTWTLQVDRWSTRTFDE
jgi:hypothetical protein